MIERVVATFQAWLHLPDPIPLLALLGAIAANLMTGDPTWLLLIGAPSGGKTELLGSLALLPYIHACGTLTEAALLSGTPKKDAGTAKGGLLREIGAFGIIACKDFGSVLAMNHDSQASTLAALREVFDGAWTRHVGTDGGRTLHWEGKVGLVGGCTPSIDRQHAVTAAMGERFLLCRLPIADEQAQAARALEHVGHEQMMRMALANAVRDLFGGIDFVEPPELTNDERGRLIELATFVVRCRSSVERDAYSREIELIPGSEAPGRLVTTLARLMRGVGAIGATEEEAWRVVRRVALDSMPALRKTIIGSLAEVEERIDTTSVAIRAGYPTTPTRRALEDLTAHGVAVRTPQGQGKADLWELSAWTRARLTAIDSQAGVPETPEPLINPHRTTNGKTGKVPLQLDPETQAYLTRRRSSPAGGAR